MLNAFRVHAYAVSPVASEEDDFDLPGGRLELSDDFRSAVRDNYERADFTNRTHVEFDFEPAERFNAMRERILSYAFDGDESADTAAEEMAEALALAMDQRSRPGLFVSSVGRDDNLREVTLWVFPSDEALQLQGGGGGETSVEVLTDVFSQTSRLRKAARFEGRRVETEFLSGRVLDHQANQSARTVADYWIGNFLQCQFGISGQQGTELLARQFRSALEEVESGGARQQLHAAIQAVRHRPNFRITMQQVGQEYLDGEARSAFEDAFPPGNEDSVFEFDRETFDEELQFSIYELDSGVRVSVPTTSDRGPVEINTDDDETRTLTCAGIIVDEKLRKQA